MPEVPPTLSLLETAVHAVGGLEGVLADALVQRLALCLESPRDGSEERRLAAMLLSPAMAVIALVEIEKPKQRRDLITHSVEINRSPEDVFAYLADFESRYCYDRYFGFGSDQSPTRARFMASGHTLIVLGDANDNGTWDAEDLSANPPRTAEQFRLARLQIR